MHFLIRSLAVLRWLAATGLVCGAALVCAAEVEPPLDTNEVIELTDVLAHAVQSPREVVQQTGSMVDAVEAGIASWYGRAFQGRRTASGERFDMNNLTAAHKTLPLGTVVQVRNPLNGKTVEVTINDRGPFVKDRIIDLSYRAAQLLGIVHAGRQPVEVQRR